MKFYDVDNVKMEGLNHQNAIFGLGIEQKTRDEGPTAYFAVDFEPSFGIDATFTCLRIEIVEAVPCNAEGRPTPIAWGCSRNPKEQSGNDKGSFPCLTAVFCSCVCP